MVDLGKDWIGPGLRQVLRHIRELAETLRLAQVDLVKRYKECEAEDRNFHGCHIQRKGIHSHHMDCLLPGHRQ